MFNKKNLKEENASPEAGTERSNPLKATLAFGTKSSAAIFSLFRMGDKNAFSKIYHHFKKPVFSYVNRRITDEAAAEEITQEIFFKVYRARESYESPKPFSPWLWTITRNTVSDWLRKHRTTPFRAEATSSEDESVHPVDELACPLPLAEHVLDRESQKHTMMLILNGLTELQRKVLLMNLIHQLSYKEIAQKLGLSLSAVKCLAYRARLALAQGFGQTSSFA